MLRLFPASPSSRIRRSRRARRLGCEALEARQLLSTFTVNEFNVDSATTSGSLRWALTQATTTPGNNTVNFDPTVFSVPRTITVTAGELSLSDTNASGGVTLTGPGANLLTINGNHASRVLDINGGPAALSGLTITGGEATSGGGLYNSSSNLSLTNVTVSGNSAAVGGGLFNSGTATLTDVTVSGNSAMYGGGLFSNSPSTLTDVTVSGNSASENGGGIYNYMSKMSLTNVTVSGNSAVTGGGLINYHGTTSLTNTIVAGNTVGGDIFGSYSGTNNLVGGNPMLASLGDYGGPTFTMPPLPGSPAINAGTTSGAPATDERGFARVGLPDVGADEAGNALVVNTTNGGIGSLPGRLSLPQAINLANVLPTADTITFASGSVFSTPQTITLSAGQLKLNDTATTTITGPGANLLTVSGNHASRVFDINGGPAAISGLTITGGSAISGGGLYNSSSNLSLTNVTVSGNSATVGGGLFNSGTATLTDVTVSGNSAEDGGGLFSNGPSTLTNVTVSANSASQNGGGLYNYTSTMSLTNVTVSGNSAISGGGLINYHGTASLTDTIVAGNTAGGDVAGSPVSSTKSLIGGNPLLARLGYYGGSTQTMPLLPGSPAVGGGTATGAPTTDQRGVARTGRVDIGAFQSQGFNVAITGGNNQSTSVDTSFSSPLSVTVSSAYGEPVAGGVVTFTGPASGASATFTGNPAVIGANGSASVSATADGIAGIFGNSATYAVSASTGAGSATFSLTNYNPPPPPILPIGINPVMPIETSAAVANAGDSLQQTVSLRNASPSAPGNTRIKVVYDTVLPKVLNAGSSRDRFVFTYSKDVTNQMATDFLN
jgi:fibronectin-binding autotransporter adhesin